MKLITDTLSEYQKTCLRLCGEALDKGDEILAGSYHRAANITSDQRQPEYVTEQAPAVLYELLKQLPYIKTSRSTLGGEDRATVLARVSLDPKTDWTNDIYYNSRYGIFSIDYTGSMELISSGDGTAKFRKCKVKSIDAVVSKILKWSNNP